MVDIQSKEVIDKISDELKIQPSMSIPRGLSKDIQLVYGVNPSQNIQFKENSAVDALTAEILTTSSIKNTYLVGISLTVAKDASNTSILSGVLATAKGKAADLRVLGIRYEPLTAEAHDKTIMLPYPILLEKNSKVLIQNSNAGASIDATGTIYFYETDPQ